MEVIYMPDFFTIVRDNKAKIILELLANHDDDECVEILQIVLSEFDKQSMTKLLCKIIEH